MVVSSRCVELRLRMPAVRIQFMFLQQTAAGRQKIAAAEQEQLAGSGRTGFDGNLLLFAAVKEVCKSAKN